MNPTSPQSIPRKHSLSSCSKLLDHCLSLKSLTSAESAHAHLVKTGFDRRPILGNRLLHVYTRLGPINSAFRVLRCLPNKNTFTWNIMVAACCRAGRMEDAQHMFDGMPHRDVVSWNTMVSGYIASGVVGKALGVLFRMRQEGVRPTGFTFSIAATCVCSGVQVKEVHGSVLRSGLGYMNVVLANSLVDKYGKFGLVRCASFVFHSMEERDILSWNSLISGYERCGHHEQALSNFGSMRESTFSPDQFTMSIVINICANMADLKKGEQAFTLCFKMGFLSNSIVSSALIDMYSKCGRLDVSIKLFDEMSDFDQAICNSMISVHARNGLADEAQQVFVSALREKGFSATEFTFSSILRSHSVPLPMEHGTQIHSMVLKLGFDAEMIVSSSLVDMYAKLGEIESAVKIFSQMAFKDLASWNTMIMGLAVNGREVEALKLFHELKVEGVLPDRITVTGVLSACSLGSMVAEGVEIFLSMEENYQVKRGAEHYAHVVNMMSRAGRLEDAMELIEAMPGKSSALDYDILLRYQIHGNMNLTELVAEKAMELNPHSPLPYLVLARIYETRGKWENVARVKRAMQTRGIEKVKGCSWIGLRNKIISFESDQWLHWGGEAMYSMLRLLVWEMRQCGYVPELCEDMGFGRD